MLFLICFLLSSCSIIFIEALIVRIENKWVKVWFVNNSWVFDLCLSHVSVWRDIKDWKFKVVYISDIGAFISALEGCMSQLNGMIQIPYTTWTLIITSWGNYGLPCFRMCLSTPWLYLLKYWLSHFMMHTYWAWF